MYTNGSDGDLQLFYSQKFVRPKKKDSRKNCVFLIKPALVYGKMKGHFVFPSQKLSGALMKIFHGTFF